MTLPVELIALGLTANCAVFTILAHVAMAILRSQRAMEVRQGIIEYKLGIPPVADSK